MKTPKSLKPLEKNPALLAAERVRKNKSGALHSVTLYVQSNGDYAGKIRIVLFVTGRNGGVSYRLEKDSVQSPFIDFCAEVRSANSYELLVSVLEKYGFETGRLG